MSLVEELVQAIRTARENWFMGRRCGVQTMAEMEARAALSHLKIPPGSESVDVGEAVAALRRECKTCDVPSLCATCSGAEALHYLGAPVD